MDKEAIIEFTQAQDGTAQIKLGGHWSIYERLKTIPDLYQQIAAGDSRRLKFDSQDLETWDTSLLAFLVDLKSHCAKYKIEFDESGLPAGAKKLLTLGEAALTNPSESAERLSWVEQQGAAFLETLRSGSELLAFIGESFVNLIRFVRGKACFRRTDFWLTVQQCGAQALPIVTIISFLVGTILAFVGAIQLERFGAEVFVANLVGLGMTREMGAMMTGIIMTGRTGAAFAAQLGTMRLNEEIDALKTFGFSPMEFLVLPRMLALVLMLPLLCLYANLVGMIGGAVVSAKLFDLSFSQYFHQLQGAVSLTDFSVGIIKSIVYAVLVALAGCLRGMQCERTAAAVGQAVTSAVVTGIVLIIVSDAIFTYLFNVLGI